MTGFILMTLFALTTFPLFAGPIEDATTPEVKGLAIAIAADERDEGWGDWSAEATMVLRNRQGQESSRQMSMKALEQQEDGDKRLIVFDDQWLYLPALERVKRIASNNKSGPFVGSEFAYEDLSSEEVEKYTYKFLRDEKLGEFDTYVVERYPVDENSGYTKQIAWIDKAEFRLIKVDYYDRKDELLKTLTADRYKTYGDNFWRAGSFSMVNHQTGKSTELVWSDYVFTQGLEERDFDQASLRRAR